MRTIPVSAPGALSFSFVHKMRVARTHTTRPRAPPIVVLSGVRAVSFGSRNREKMAFFTLMTAYLALFGILLFILLFGESEMFEGTVVESCHWLVSDGLCVGFSWALRKVLGNTLGSRVENTVNEWLCDRPNPAMQLTYVTLVMGGYWTFCVHAYDLLGLYMSTVHRHALPVIMIVSIASWLATCWSDPGIVTPQNLEAHLRAYPFDHVLYTPKECPTMGIMCPARSKFCRVTRRRISKFDHFCGWMNNAIGENNLRYFVTFLAVHVVMTSYGAWLCLGIVKGEITRRGLWTVAFQGNAGEPVTMAEDWRLMTKFCMYHFGPVIMLGVFLLILAIMLSAFLGYHLWMIKEGVTTNETFKWKDHRRRVLRAAKVAVNGDGKDAHCADEDAVGGDDEREVGCVGATPLAANREGRDLKSAEAVEAGSAGLLTRVPCGWCLRLFGRTSARESTTDTGLKVDIPFTRNIYDKGLMQNIGEVFFPPSQRAARELAKLAAVSSHAGPTNQSGSRQRKGNQRKSRRV